MLKASLSLPSARAVAMLAVFLTAACAPMTTGVSPQSRAAPVAKEALDRRLNVVVFLVDDMGWRDTGFSGSKFYETPNIDRLVSQGMVFTNAYSASPVCSPSRAALMTGRDPVRFGITDWIPGYKPKQPVKLDTPSIPDALPLDARTIGEYFSDAGYITAFVGKWHLGQTEPFWPQHQGFDFNIGGWSPGAPRGRGAAGAYFAPHRNPSLSDGPDGEFLTERLGRETANFIQQNENRPFMAVHAFYQVHTPLNEAPAHIDHFRAKAAQLNADTTVPREMRFGQKAKGRQDDPVYASMVAAVDTEVGRIVAQLERSGILDRTVIVFTSDNGGLSVRRSDPNKAPTSNEPMRGTKGWLYEGGIRVPLAIIAPGVTRAGERNDRLATSIDLLPTLLGLTGIEQSGDLDGVNLLSASSQQRMLAWHFPHYHATRWRPGGAIRDERWKLIQFFEDDAVQLYDLANDPYETRDLVVEKPDVAAMMRARLAAWRAEHGAKMPVERE
jgi:arylsulfatase A-like enzyme